MEPYVSSNDFCYGKFITTVVAIVPAAYVKDFLSSYEMFSNYVVPESAKQLKIPEKDGLTIWYAFIYLGKSIYSLKELKSWIDNK